jgi:hypothetical protein
MMPAKRNWVSSKNSSRIPGNIRARSYVKIIIDISRGHMIRKNPRLEVS